MLSANIFGTFNQYYSDALSEKMRGRTRQSAAAGPFPWRAVVGKLGPNIKPDEERAPHIRPGCKLMATGRLEYAQENGFLNPKDVAFPVVLRI